MYIFLNKIIFKIKFSRRKIKYPTYCLMLLESNVQYFIISCYGDVSDLTSRSRYRRYHLAPHATLPLSLTSIFFTLSTFFFLHNSYNM